MQPADVFIFRILDLGTSSSQKRGAGMKKVSIIAILALFFLP
jgi:hypothetical protein